MIRHEKKRVMKAMEKNFIIRFNFPLFFMLGFVSGGKPVGFMAGEKPHAGGMFKRMKPDKVRPDIIYSSLLRHYLRITGRKLQYN